MQYNLSGEAVRDLLKQCRDNLSQVHQALEILSLERLVELIDTQAPRFRPLLGRLVLGRELGSLLLPPMPPELLVEEQTAFLRLVRLERPEFLPLASELVRGREQAAATMVEIHLDQLVEAEVWSHPVQVLERPRSDFRALLAACRRRLRKASGAEYTRLIEVRQRLERAVRIAESARMRRRRLKPGAGGGAGPSG